MAEEKTECRTPSAGKSGVTRIPTWKYEAVRAAILKVLGEAGDAGFPFADLTDAVDGLLSDDERARMGSVGWHTATVKLNLEVLGEVERLKGLSPQRLRLTSD